MFTSAVMTAMTWTIERYPDCHYADCPLEDRRVVTGLTITGLSSSRYSWACSFLPTPCAYTPNVS